MTVTVKSLFLALLYSLCVLAGGYSGMRGGWYVGATGGIVAVLSIAGLWSAPAMGWSSFWGFMYGLATGMALSLSAPLPLAAVIADVVPSREAVVLAVCPWFAPVAYLLLRRGWASGYSRSHPYAMLLLGVLSVLYALTLTVTILLYEFVSY